MKRGKTTQKKVSNSKKKVSKKTLTQKQWLAISIIAFFVFAIALSFVNISQNASVTGQGIIENLDGKDPEAEGGIKDMPIEEEESAIKAMFTGFAQDTTFDINIIKYIMWFTLLVFIVGILKFLDFPPNGFLQFLIGLGVSFLAIVYVTPGEMYNMLAGYTALALTLTSVLPFIIMLGASVMLTGNAQISKMSIGKVLIEIVLWVMWVGFLIYRLIKVWAQRGAVNLIFKEGGIVMIIVLALSLFIVIFNKKFREWVTTIGIQVFDEQKRLQRRVAAQAERDRITQAKTAQEEMNRKSDKAPK